jgi:hypothetical protein
MIQLPRLSVTARTFTPVMPRVLQSDATLQLVTIYQALRAAPPAPIRQSAKQAVDRPSSYCLLLTEHCYGYFRVSSTPTKSVSSDLLTLLSLRSVGVYSRMLTRPGPLCMQDRVPCLSICSLTDHVDCISFHGTSESRSCTCIPGAFTTTGTPSYLAFTI